MNEDKIYNLNSGDIVPDCISGEHKWIGLSAPKNYTSGLYTEQCEKCKIIQEYDTSD